MSFEIKDNRNTATQLMKQNAKDQCARDLDVELTLSEAVLEMADLIMSIQSENADLKERVKVLEGI